MPGGDGTGPREQGQGQGYGPGAQPGECVCPKCGTKVPHQAGTPCNTILCPNCGERMIRQ